MIFSSCGYKTTYVDYHKPKTVKWLKSGKIKYANTKQTKKGRERVALENQKRKEQEILTKMKENNIPRQPIIIQIKGTGMVDYFTGNSFQIAEYKGRLKLENRRYVIYPEIEVDFQPLKSAHPAVYADLSTADQETWTKLIIDAGFRLTKISHKELEFKLPNTDISGSTK